MQDPTSSPYPRRLLLDSFLAAVSAADPSAILCEHLPQRGQGRVLVVGAGKAAASMALAVEKAWPDEPLSGLVVTRYGHGAPTVRVEVVEAGHPVPDTAGEQAAARMLDQVRLLDTDDLLIVLVSGGGSSLLTLPAPGLSMDDLKALNRELLRCGAPITEMNIVRKHVSAITGGRLAAASRARVVALIISDVTGDDPSAIASGPCSPDPSTFQDALGIVLRYGIEAPAAIRRHLEAGVRGDVPETPKPGDALFQRVENTVIATPHQSLSAAATWFRTRSIVPILLGDTVTGEAREVAKVYAALVREIRHHGEPWKTPVALISGGECTVTIARENLSTGRGGRCSEFLLALAIELDGMSDVYALAADTDGIDGSEDNAGAIVFPDSLRRARDLDCVAQSALAANDAWGFFDCLGDLVVTGPTRTNVNDYRVILIL